MISRVCFTIALASSFALTAARSPLGEKTKFVARFAAIGGLASVVYGMYNKSEKATSAGIGILTGLGCAVLEQYTQYYVANDNLVPFIVASSWAAEKMARHQLVYDINPSYAVDNDKVRHASWVSYLAYHAARYTDNN